MFNIVNKVCYGRKFNCSDDPIFDQDFPGVTSVLSDVASRKSQTRVIRAVYDARLNRSDVPWGHGSGKSGLANPIGRQFLPRISALESVGHCRAAETSPNSNSSSQIEKGQLI